MAEGLRQSLQHGAEGVPLLPQAHEGVHDRLRPEPAHVRVTGRGRDTRDALLVSLQPGAQPPAAQPGSSRERPSGPVGAVELTQVPRREAPARERPPAISVLLHVLQPEPEAPVRFLIAPIAARGAQTGR